MVKNHSDCEKGNPLPPHGLFELPVSIVLVWNKVLLISPYQLGQHLQGKNGGDNWFIKILNATNCERHSREATLTVF